MDWEDARYVRLYVKDDGDWATWDWQARAVFPLILRECNPVGLVKMGKKGVAGLAALLRLPLDVVQPGIACLMEDGCVVEPAPGMLWVRNYRKAQEAKQSDKARKEAERARKSAALEAAAIGIETDNSVTKRDSESRTVTERHDRSQPVTHSIAQHISVPSEQGDTADGAPVFQLTPADPPPSLPFRARAAVEAVEASSQGRFRAPKKLKSGHAIAIEQRGIVLYPKLEQWTELGKWIAAGGVSRTVVDIGALATKCDEWFPFVADWCRNGRKPIAPTVGRSISIPTGPARVTPEAAPPPRQHAGPDDPDARRREREEAQRLARETA